MSTSIITEIETAASALTTAVAGAVSPISSLIDDGLKIGTEVIKSYEQEKTLVNTPVIETNVEAQKIEAEKLKIENEVAKNDLTTDQKLTAL